MAQSGLEYGKHWASPVFDQEDDMTTKEKTRKTRSRSTRRPVTAAASGVQGLPAASDAIEQASVSDMPLHAIVPAPDVGDDAGTAGGSGARSETSGLEPEAPWNDLSEPGIRRSRNVRELLAIGVGQVELLSFRVGREIFAIDLASVDEAVESDAVHAVPDMPGSMLGVFELRGRLVPVFSPSRVLRAELSSPDGVMLLMRSGDRRVGIAVDDVEDVILVDVPSLRRPVLDDAGDGLLLGVAASDAGLVGILDGSALVAACTGYSLPEAA